jgi:ATP-dependent RNA helicase SUPV3L1/SUV3
LGILRLYTNAIRVELDAVLSFCPVYEWVEGMMRVSDCQPKRHRSIYILEALHKVLILYLWLSFHNAMAFYDTDEVYALKARVERALEQCLRRGGIWRALRML